MTAPPVKVGARERDCRPGGLGAHPQSPGSENLEGGVVVKGAATEHLAPAIRRSFPRRRTQPPGTRSPARRAGRATVAVSDSPATQRLAPLLGHIRGGRGEEDRVLVTPLAEASARRLPGTRRGRRRGTDRSAPRRAPHMPLRSPSSGLSRAGNCGWPRCGSA